jgi:hypothetical protein
MAAATSNEPGTDPMNTPEFPERPSNPRFNTLLSNIRDTVLVFLNAQLNDFFSSADNALLEFAEQTQSIAMQGRFFEAIAVIKKHQSAIEQRFRSAIHEGFEQFGTPPPSAERPALELSLIAHEDMEESVVTENLLLKSNDSYYMPLYALEQRLAVINHGHRIPLEHIPASPHHLVEAFRAALEPLLIDIKVKLVLYALFDKFVMRQLKSLYDEINDGLKEAGILPNLKPVFIKPTPAGRPATATDNEAQTDNPVAASHNAPAHTQPTGNQAQPSLGEELFGSILELMASRRQSITQPPPAVGASQQPVPPSQNTPPRVARSAHEQLLSALDSLHQNSQLPASGVLSDIEALPDIVVDTQLIQRLQQTLQGERAQIYAQVPPHQLNSIDTDTVELIGMLFEYMLNDPALPNLAKALLSHLHTPYLKLSLKDRQLLVDSEHPTRLLLDMLVEAGGQWVHENDNKRGIFPSMQTVVKRVLQEATENDNLFDELLDYFNTAMDEQRRKSNIIEERARATLKGREKFHLAKQRAAQEMKTRSEQIALPNSVVRFFTQTWNDRLMFILLRHAEGENSREWRNALQLADNLLGFFMPEASNTSAQKRKQTGSALKREIQDTLDAVGGPHLRYLDELFGYLQNPATLADWQAEQAQVKTARPSPQQPATVVSAEKSAPTPTSAGTKTADTATANGELSAREQDIIEKLKRVKFGTWFEFKTRSGSPQRFKLSWLSPLTSTCMFVDRAGMQADVKTIGVLASMMLNGQAKLIPRPKQQFVERALLAIKNTLQRSMEATD